MRLRLAVLGGLALALAGCGSAVSPGNSPSGTNGAIGSATQRSPTTPFPSTTPVAPAGNVLTDANNRATVTVATGARLTIDLTSEPGAYAWDRPRLTGAGLRLVSVAGGYPARGPMMAVLLATSPGTVMVSSVGDFPCLHSRPVCALAVRSWTIQVIIRSK
jgi:hypothetical protein